MADHRDQKIALRRRLPPRRAHRLEDDAGLRALRRAEFVQAPGLQHDDAIGELQRCTRVGIAADIAVQVGAREHQHQGALRLRALPRMHRRVAAARVQGHEHIAGTAVPVQRDAGLMAQGAQMPGPAQRGTAVAVARPGRSRRHNAYAQAFHRRRGGAIARWTSGLAIGRLLPGRCGQYSRVAGGRRAKLSNLTNNCAANAGGV